MIGNAATEEIFPSRGRLSELIIESLGDEFNNILMAIMGKADLQVSELDANTEAQTSLSEIRTASRRAADLCSQMLTYAGKGEFQSQKLDWAKLIQVMRGILDVTLGKRVVLNCQFETDLPRKWGGKWICIFLHHQTCWARIGSLCRAWYCKRTPRSGVSEKPFRVR